MRNNEHHHNQHTQHTRHHDHIDAIDHVRNVGIMAHIDAGKTTVSERILFFTGRSHKVGEVHDGTAVLDWMEQERARGITITAAATSCHWADHRINLIDTPGHVDFTIEVERSLRVLDGAVAVLDAVAGVEPQTETVWRQADRHGVPRLCFVNKMDRAGADLGRCVEQLRARLGVRPAVVQLVLGHEADLRGVIDVVRRRALVWAPRSNGRVYATEAVDDASAPDVEAARAALVELLAEHDDVMLEAFLDHRDPSASELAAALRRATIAGDVVPVLCGSALANIGIQPLLDAVVAYLPSPTDVGGVIGHDPHDRQVAVTRSADAAGPFAALAFKVMSPPTGRLTFVRVYAGTVARGDQVWNPTSGRTERIARLVELHAASIADVELATAGAIVAIIGLKATTTGHTLCTDTAPVVFETIDVPEPVISVAIEPATAVDQAKLGAAIGHLGDEDPSLRVRQDRETGETILSGMGELHLEVIVERLRELGVVVSVGAPRVAYRETISSPVTGHRTRLRKQNGGAGLFAEIVVDVRPRPRRAGGEPGQPDRPDQPEEVTVIDAVTGGAVPAVYVAAAARGIREAMVAGPLGGHPLVGVEVTITDGAVHAKDSSELAFRAAGAQALREAVAQASPVLLEPVMQLTIDVPDELLGAVMGDLASRRGRVEGLDDGVPGGRVLRGRAPLAELFGYAGALRNITQGRAGVTMAFGTYEEVPDTVALRLAR